MCGIIFLLTTPIAGPTCGEKMALAEFQIISETFVSPLLYGTAMIPY
jgi:hypothetical protein